ncbi:GNAT family N-acetyltransferase [Cellulomonas sp. NPDC089187]|uniref:GNAT family N-acetyltransferase n=1 Tax=Cellulomonas sp. NPDC089187 TaxID=3154970 RepID=UPI00343CD2ED
MTQVRPATTADLPFLTAHDRHLDPTLFPGLIADGRFLVAEDDGHACGLLRWNLFWDEIPFMNMLMVVEEVRDRGHGAALVNAWEATMAERGHRTVMTSAQADESAQHFYRARGYRDCGALLLPDQATELVFRKELTPRDVGGRS